MFTNENEFKKIVDGLDIDTKPNDSHSAKLREQMRTQWAGGMDSEVRDTHTRQWRF